MSKPQANNKRIAKNTVLLYIRMLVLMLVSLYTSRVVLAALGVEDYGIYNVVGGIVVLFTFINNAMVTSTQRYLNFELGRNDTLQAQKVFSISLNIHILIALLILLLSETVGLWFLNTTIQYPETKEFAVHITYQFSILTTCVRIIRTPYNAAIIAHENMSFYAYLSIFEAVLQLAIVFMLMMFGANRLILYSLLLFVVAVIIYLCYYIYCKKSFAVCHYKVYKDKLLYKKLLSFSGWSLFGGMANMGASQGLNILLNIFFGVTVNAAMGIASQVNTAVTSFVHSFQTAFNPQIVKSYAKGDHDYFIKLILSTSKYSYLLLFILVLPIYICTTEILNIWLTEVPEYAISFCRLMLIFSLLDALQGPLWFSVQATGKIKTYQILMSFMILSNLPITYICLKLGNSPDTALIVKCIVNFLTLFVRIWYLRKLYKFPVYEFFIKVICRIIPITVLGYMLIYIPIECSSDFIKVLVVLPETIVANVVLLITIGLNSDEKDVLFRNIRKIYEKCKRC